MESRRADFNKLISYVESNYRMNLSERDYEYLKEITDKYSAQEIKLALDYSKDKKTDSLVYLKDALANKYYLNKQEQFIPEWIRNPEMCKAEPLDEDDKEWCRGFYKKYCDTEEEYLIRIKEVGLVE